MHAKVTQTNPCYLRDKQTLLITDGAAALLITLVLTDELDRTCRDDMSTV